MDKYFEFVLSSDSLGVSKPDKRVYQAVKAKMEKEIGQDLDLYYIASHPFDIMGATSTKFFKTILVDCTPAQTERAILETMLGAKGEKADYIVRGLARVPKAIS